MRMDNHLREVTQEEEAKKLRNKTKKAEPKTEDPAYNETMKIVGFMPKRGDFETEYDEEAETRVCEMEFSEDDPEEEVKLKYQVLEHYNSRIDE